MMMPTSHLEQLSETLKLSPSTIIILSIIVFIVIPITTLYNKQVLKSNSKTVNLKAMTKSYTPLPVNIARNKDRNYGEWKPEIFEYPPVEEFKGWSIKDTKPLPYRAFKHTYFITMGIRSMEFNNWFELDNEWMKYHNRKLERVKERGDELYGTSDDSWDAAIELLMEFRNYLPIRYPTLFEKTSKGIENLVTGEIFEFIDILKEDFKMDPMLMAALMTQDDLAVLTENKKGQYILKAGAIMLAGFWRLKDKLNLPLSAIHTTGDVPKYESKLQTPMEKFFIRATCDKPVVRNNYFLQTDSDLAWSHSIGEEDNENVGWYTASPATDISKIYYRSERQSVRRLPLTGAMTFTIRTYFLPVTEMCKEPYVPKRLLDGILSWDEDVKNYRGYEKFKDVLLPYLEKKAKEQEDAGYTVETEKSQYPY